MENSCLLSSCMVSINYFKSPSLHLPKNHYLPTFREFVQPKLMRDQPWNCRMVLNVTIIDQTINLPSSAFFTTSHVGSEFWLLPPYSTSWWLIVNKPGAGRSTEHPLIACRVLEKEGWQTQKVKLSYRANPISSFIQKLGPIAMIWATAMLEGLSPHPQTS